MVRPMIDTAAMPMLNTFRRVAPLTWLACSAALWLTACAQKPVTVDAPPPSVMSSSAAMPAPSAAHAAAHTAQHALDWAGTYQGILPCQGCPGTAIRVQLRPDMTAAVRERRLGTPAEQDTGPTYQGPLRFGQGNQTSLISLGNPQEQVPAYRFFVGEGWIELRDRTTGAPLDSGTQYRLRRTSLP